MMVNHDSCSQNRIDWDKVPNPSKMTSVETCYEEKSKQMYIKRKRDEHSTYTTALLIGTLLLTTFATALNCFSLLTNYWEYITWNSPALTKISLEQNVGIESYFDNLITRVFVTNSKNSTVSIYLLPMHGGIWTICISLKGKPNLYQVDNQGVYRVAGMIRI